MPVYSRNSISWRRRIRGC